MLSVISYPVFVLSVIVALVFSISLFPVGWFEFRPEWLGLVVFYWTFRAPAQFGILLAWCLGLLLDQLHGKRKPSMVHSACHGCLALDVFGGTTELLRAALNSRSVLSSRSVRWGFSMADI